MGLGDGAATGERKFVGNVERGTGVSDMNSFEQEDQFVLPTYSKLPMALVRGRGSWVEDQAGERYLDLYGGHAVTLLGHSHPKWVAALKEQLDALDFYSNVSYHPLRADAARRLVEHSYPSMASAYFCNSGAEAVETALKIARGATGRERVIALERDFHGRTAGALGVAGNPKLRDQFPASLGSFTDFVPLGDLDALRAIDPAAVAALILEPIQSLAGVYLAPPEYYVELRRYCSEHGIQLIFDEVQTGSGRTGEWYVGTHWDVEPDLVTTAKGVGGGFPVGVVLVNRSLTDGVSVGDHGSTFGGGPLAVAAVSATYRILEEEGLVSAVAKRGAEVRRRLEALVGGPVVREVRGLGYLLGVECTVPAADVHRHLLAAKILVGKSGDPNTLRLLPPLTVTDEEWDLFFSALESFEPAAATA